MEILGVRPNSPAITISVLSSRPVRVQVVEQRREGPVGRREELVLQAREGVAVRVPRLVVAEVDLHQVDARLDQPEGHQQRPAEAVPAVAVLDRVGRPSSRRRRGEPSASASKRDRRLAMAVEPLGRGRRFQVAPLAVDVAQQAELGPRSRSRAEALRAERQTRRLKRRGRRATLGGFLVSLGNVYSG